MATDPSPAALPVYLQAAQPNPPEKRAPWYLNTAPTYAGIFLWFVFWNSVSADSLPGGGLTGALIGVVIAALICHFLFYLVPGLFGMKTGLPLYIVGSSTFGAVGSLIIPGFLMGILQFGWLAVNTYFAASALAVAFTGGAGQTAVFYALCVVWAGLAAFIGLKGIQYVAKVATFLPLLPLAVLVFALVKFAGSAGADPETPAGPWTLDTVLAGALPMVAYIVGFFATAGAAGVDFGVNSRNGRDVQLGGLFGIVAAIIFTAGASVIAVAGAHAQHHLPNPTTNAERHKQVEQKVPMDQVEKDTLTREYTLTNAIQDVVDGRTFAIIMALLTLAAFPGACFSSFIAANSFKTVMPRVNPFVSVGLGALVSIVLAVTGVAKDLPSVFGLIGASFGPICGAMFADYILNRGRWSGPRAGLNPAGWIAWAVGFLVGIAPNLSAWLPVQVRAWLPVQVPAAPVVAFVVGALVYYVLTGVGLASRVVPYVPAAKQNPA
jgi:cytosine permease